MGLMLEISNEVVQAMRVPPPEVEARMRLELAIGLYSQQILPLGKAAQLAELNRWEFNDILARRGIPMHYTERDLAHDISYANRDQ